MNYPGRNKAIYEFPLVEYIPLYPLNPARTASSPGNGHSPVSALFLAGDLSTWEALTNRYALPADSGAADFHSEIGVIVLNTQVYEVKYRDRRVTLVGRPDPGSVHAFRLNKRLFYHHNLEFTLFTPAGARLARSRIRI